MDVPGLQTFRGGDFLSIRVSIEYRQGDVRPFSLFPLGERAGERGLRGREEASFVENNGKFLDFETFSFTLKSTIGGTEPIRAGVFSGPWMEVTTWSECQ